MTHLESNVDLANVAARDTIFDDVHLDTSVEQIKCSLEHTDVRFDTKDDDVLNVTRVVEPLVGDTWEMHAKLGLGVICIGRKLGQLLKEVAQW